LPGGSDGSHGVAHLTRVWKNASAIQAEEGGDEIILVASVLLHDCVFVEKDSPLRPKASQFAAEKACTILSELGWEQELISKIAHAIEAHSFSASIKPESLEAKILQDADRLDAIGMVGVARCFYVAGRLNELLYHPTDPEAKDREPDDITYALDHFQTKLFKLGSGFQTTTGRRLAHVRHARLQYFFDRFLEEI
jgi:uncharacterized protein